MRVSTRIIAGIGVLMILAFAALTYQAYVNRQLQSATEQFSDVNQDATTTVAWMQSDIQTIHEFSQKYFLVDRESYGANLKGWWKTFEDRVRKLQGMPLSERERTDVSRVAKAWEDYRIAWDIETEENPTGQSDTIPLDIETCQGILADRIDQLEMTIKEAVEKRASEAKTMRARAQTLSWIAAGGALLIGGFTSILLLRTIEQSVRQLTKGTRAITQGDFSHRIAAKDYDEFAELARDFNAMSQRLGELDQMKKDFVSHVSHELKAPLASIRQTAHLMLEEIPGTLNEQQRRLLRLSYNSAERLAAMVGNLLDVSRLEAGSMEYTMAPLDLLSLVRTVAEEFEVQAKDKEIRFHIDGGSGQSFLVSCDRDRMTQVIGNLLDNALKFSPRGAEIVVKLRERIDGGERIVLLTVADEGPGIADDHKEKIFTKFHQVKHGKKLTGQGVGLGLAICRTIVEAHQGKIWVMDNSPGGSIFCMELQAAARMEVATTCG